MVGTSQTSCMTYIQKESSETLLDWLSVYIFLCDILHLGIASSFFLYIIYLFHLESYLHCSLINTYTHTHIIHSGPPYI